jgi:glycosyltransferase involved in cell wall biosynthesis
VPPTLTVLMTTYHGTSVEELERSIASLVGQTRPADELLVVVDGPVPQPLDAALAAASAQHPEMRVERLPRNLGSGLASARGLELATGDFLARHDADDVSLPQRFAREMAVIEERGLDLVGSAMLEFEGSPEHVVGVRTTPRTHEQIAARMRLNNPINNPTVIFRRRLAVDVGGYADLRYMQDYDLFARLLAAGARAENLEEPLVLFNAGEGMISRRGGWRMVRHEWDVQRRLLATGTIGPVLLVRNMVVRGAFRVMPPALLRRVYAVLFRTRGGTPEVAGSPAGSGSA